MMDILKAQIEKKRKQLEERELINPDRKFFKRDELIEAERREYLKRQQSRAGQSSTNASSDSSLNSDYSQTNNTLAGHNAAFNTNRDKQLEEIIFSRKEVIKRLRERSEPILLFGETEHEAFMRLKHLELINPDQTRGQVNDFQRAMEQVDQAYLNEILKSSDGMKSEESKKTLYDVKIDPMNLTLEQIKEMAKGLGHKNNQQEDSKIIITFLKFMLEVWGRNLNARPENLKASTQGKMSCAIYTQTQIYLRPLFKQLMKNTLPPDIVTFLREIVKHLLDRNYVKANDAYLRLAIGNAAWPIGVTMVGIHARTGREKIFAQNIAHVLNDETQRKYIQGLKRLITQCQISFETDPSFCVEYGAIST